jgi:hypothetical protein
MAGETICQQLAEVLAHLCLGENWQQGQVCGGPDITRGYAVCIHQGAIVAYAFVGVMNEALKSLRLELLYAFVWPPL